MCREDLKTDARRPGEKICRQPCRRRRPRLFEFFRPLNLLSANSHYAHDDPTSWPNGAYVRTKWGNHVLWHSVEDGGRHLPPDLLDKYRLEGDPEVDGILKLMRSEGTPLGAGDDLLRRAEQAASLNLDSTKLSESDVALAKFYQKYSQIPTWVDWSQVKKGQQVFLAYLPAISYSLFYRSLLPGFSIPKIAAVLQSTRYLAPPSTREQVRNRLMDTGALLAACCCHPASDGDETKKKRPDSLAGIDVCLLPGKVGWKTALHVRILHAKVRQALLQEQVNSWNTKELGVPINQEDLAATLLAFSTNAMWGCEMILGKPLPKDERDAYLAFWRYIGWLLGIPTNGDDQGCVNRPLDPCGPGWISSKPDPTLHSHAIFESLIDHLMDPNEASIEICHHLLKIGRNDEQRREGRNDATSNQGKNNWYYFRALQCRRFIGPDLADALELPYHPVWKTRLWLWAASTMYLLTLRFYTMAALPLFSPIRRMIMRFHQRRMQVFLEKTWKPGHLKRMGNELKKNSEASGGTEAAVVSSCPFAMVAAPQPKGDYGR